MLLVHSFEPLAEFAAWDRARPLRNPGMGLPRLVPSSLMGKQTYCSKNTIALAQSGPGWRPPPWQAGCWLIPSWPVPSHGGTGESPLVMCSGALLSVCWRQEEILRAGVENKMKVVGLGFFNELLLTGSRGRKGTGGDKAAGVPGRDGRSERVRACGVVGQTQPISPSIPRVRLWRGNFC